MNIKTQMQFVLVLGLSQFAIACAQSLPDTTEKVSASSVDSQHSNPANTIAALDLIATSYSIPVGGQATLAASGGTAPYSYASSNTGFGTIVGTLFTGVAPGSVTITVTDAAGATDTVNLLVVAANTANNVVNNPVAAVVQTTMSPNYSSLTGTGNGLPAYKILVNQEVGSLPLYLCSDNISGNPLYLGTAATCVKTTFVVGYVYATQVAGTIPLHRLKGKRIQGTAISGLVIYDTNAEATSVPYPYTDGGIIGYVPQ